GHAQIGAGFIDEFQALARVECPVLDKAAAQALDARRVTRAIMQRLFLRAMPVSATPATAGWGARSRRGPRPRAHIVQLASHPDADALRRATRRHTVPACAAVRACHSPARRWPWRAIGACNAPPTRD